MKPAEKMVTVKPNDTTLQTIPQMMKRDLSRLNKPESELCIINMSVFARTTSMRLMLRR